MVVSKHNYGCILDICITDVCAENPNFLINDQTIGVFLEIGITDVCAKNPNGRVKNEPIRSQRVRHQVRRMIAS